MRSVAIGVYSSSDDSRVLVSITNYPSSVMAKMKKKEIAQLAGSVLNILGKVVDILDRADLECDDTHEEEEPHEEPHQEPQDDSNEEYALTPDEEQALDAALEASYSAEADEEEVFKREEKKRRNNEARKESRRIGREFMERIKKAREENAIPNTPPSARKAVVTKLCKDLREDKTDCASCMKNYKGVCVCGKCVVELARDGETEASEYEKACQRADIEPDPNHLHTFPGSESEKEIIARQPGSAPDSSEQPEEGEKSNKKYGRRESYNEKRDGEEYRSRIMQKNSPLKGTAPTARYAVKLHRKTWHFATMSALAEFLEVPYSTINKAAMRRTGDTFEFRGIKITKKSYEGNNSHTDTGTCVLGD